MSRFKNVTIGNYVWRAIFFKDKFIPLYIVGRVGDCIR